MSETQAPPSAPAPPTHSLSDAAVPRAVREAAARADAAMQAARTARENPQQPAPGADDAPQMQVLTPSPEETPPPTEQRPQEQPQPPAENKDDLEQRYRSLKGRHEAETSRLQAHIDGLRDLIANLQARPAAAAPDADTRPVETFKAGPDSEITEDERRDYGPDLMAFMRKVATQVAYEVAGKVRDEVRQVEARVGTVQTSVQQTAQDRFFSSLASAVPDWQEMNSDPAFTSWLAQIEPYAGVSRQTLLNAAVTETNAARAAAFFTGYKREQQAVSPQSSQPAPSGPAINGQGNGKVPLENLAAPGRAKPGASGAPQDKPRYTPSDITRFYNDKAHGRWNGREAEFARIEADIVAAQREGRIMI